MQRVVRMTIPATEAALLRSSAVFTFGASTSLGPCCLPDTVQPCEAFTAKHYSTCSPVHTTLRRSSRSLSIQLLTCSSSTAQSSSSNEVLSGPGSSLGFAASHSSQAVAAQTSGSTPGTSHFSVTFPVDDPSDPGARMTPIMVVEKLDEYIIGQAGCHAIMPFYAS